MAANEFMTGGVGISASRENSHALLDTMVARHAPIYNPEYTLTDDFTIATNAAHVHDDGDTYIALIGNPYLKAHGHTSKSVNPVDLARSVAQRFRDAGPEVLANIGGGFMLAAYDRKARRLVLAVDRIGQKHLYYAQYNGGLVFSTRADAIAACSDKLHRIDNQGIYNYFYFHALPSPGSIYKGVSKLENSQLLVFENGRISTRRYWQPAFSEEPGADTQQSGREMLEIIQGSVARLANGDNVGAFLSGGLDSSTVSGMLARTKQRAKTFSIGFNAQGYDETEYARTAAGHFGTVQHEYYVTPEDVASQVANIAAYFDEPFGNSSALPAYFCAKLARENGVGRLLAGDGGDELFAGNERYAKQKIFEYYNTIPSFLKNIAIEPVFCKLPITGKIPVLKKITSYINQANIPLPDRLETYNYLHRHAAGEIFSHEFLSDIDQEMPINLLRQVYNDVENASTLNRMLWLDWKKTLHDNDLVKVNRMCEMAGVEVVYPLLDDELVEFSCRIPSEMKLNGQKLRWFYKEAVKGFLPDRIINKSKHGFGLPFGIWTSEHKGLQDLSYSSLESLKARNIFNNEFIDNTIMMHKSVHAKFYGELVWILMMLELWLAGSSL